jgi:hypothetical protein
MRPSSCYADGTARFAVRRYQPTRRVPGIGAESSLRFAIIEQGISRLPAAARPAALFEWREREETK